MSCRSWLTVMALISGIAVTVNADPKEPVIDSSTRKSAQPTVDSLNCAIDRWYEAVLAGDNGLAHQYEKKLLKSLSIDIDQTQDQLRTLASQLSPSLSEKELSHPDSIPDPLRDSLTQLKETLRAKQALADAISRSDALSNKYRLLGDYVGLLRREVGLPKLKLAVDKKLEADKN